MTFDKLGTTNPPHHRLLIRVIIGALAGLFVGIFFGPPAKVLQPIGHIYVMLLQSVIYPYLISALISNLGKAPPSLSFKIFKIGGLVYLGLIVAVYSVTIILGLGVPLPFMTIAHPGNLASHAFSYDSLLVLLIPANVIASLADNAIPAVIIFSILFGLTLQHIEKKETLLNTLDTIKAVSLKFWGWVVRLAPIGVFALLGNIAGTVEVYHLVQLAEFLIVFFGLALVIVFWILPGLTSTFTGLSYREIFRELKSPIILSLATTLTIVSLPMIQASAKKLIRKRIENPGKESDELIDTTAVVSFPFAQLGGVLLYCYIIFCLFYFNHPVTTTQKFLLPIINFFSSIGTTNSLIDSVEFMAKWLHLPEVTTSLFVSMLPIVIYGKIFISVMAYTFMTYLVGFNYHRLLTFSWLKFVWYFVVPLLLVIAATIAIRYWTPRPGAEVSKRLDTFEISPALKQGVKTIILKPGQPAPTVERKIDSIYAIQKTGILRVGFNANNKPFVFYNDKHELVGFDVAMMYALARDLNVDIVFIPFKWYNLVNDIQANKFDIAISGIYVTDQRLQEVYFTKPYMKSPIAFAAPKSSIRDYLDANTIATMKNLTIASLHDPVMVPLLKQNFPNAKILQSQRFDKTTANQLNSGEANFAAWTQIQLNIWALKHPNIATIVPTHLAAPLLMAYMINTNSESFLSFLNYWLTLKQDDGIFNDAYHHWILVEPDIKLQKRWNILNNLIGVQY